MILKKRKIKKDISISTMVASVLLVLGFVWVNTFIRQNSYDALYGNYSSLITVLSIAFSTALYYWLLNDEPMDEPLRDTTRLCVISTAISCVVLLLAFLLELGTESFSLFGQREIILFNIFTIPKKYFFDFWAIVWFPYNVGVFFRAMKKEHFQGTSVFCGIISIMGITLEGILIFRPMYNIWLVDLMVLNIATIAFAVWKYVLPDQTIKKGNAIAGIVLYSVVRLLLLPLQCNYWGDKFTTFIYGGDWDALINGIQDVSANAAFIGTSKYLINSAAVHNWLLNRNKPVSQLLFYGGWIAVIGLMIALVLFVVILFKILQVKSGREHRNWLVFATAVAMLTIRAVMGALYGFGFPYPVVIPFFGTAGIVTDTMAFTLILICGFENIKIQKYFRTEESFYPAEDILGVQDSYEVRDEFGEAYKEEDYLDAVLIKGKDGNISCVADWYSREHREFCIFDIASPIGDKKRFILEFADEKWVLTKDADNLIEDIQRVFKENLKPECMEIMEDEYEDMDFEDE